MFQTPQTRSKKKKMTKKELSVQFVKKNKILWVGVLQDLWQRVQRSATEYL